MNVLMLGNGFDINYKLLTKYINFLNIVNHIAKTSPIDVKTVGDILKAENLKFTDKDIASSYQAYQQVYENTQLEDGVLDKLSALANNNLLFSFLHKSFNRDVGWIDFEREIATVLRSFQNFLPKLNTRFHGSNLPENPVDRHILEMFGFFYMQTKKAELTTGGRYIDAEYAINDEYIIEYPLGSGNKKINDEEIVKALGKQLLELAEGLRIYLHCFVEKPVMQMCEGKLLQPMSALSHAEYIVTFNYTNTYELVYRAGKTFHIHGNTKDRIILGINPDEADQLATINTLFVRFKKYFQRVIYHTDDEYLKWVIQKHSNVSLVVMGHSLDVTDKDIIIQMFNMAKDITVLYYNENSEASLVTNLINIYGKEQFDELRIKKGLRFLPQNASYNSFAEDRHAKEQAAIASMYRHLL